MFTNLLASALAAGFGAFAGAMTAYFLACRRDRLRQKQEYLCLLLVVHEHLESLYTLFADVPDEIISESDGKKIVTFDLPLPDLPISTEQTLTLMEVSPDKDMPASLIKLQHFLQSHSRRVAKDGLNVLPLSWIQQQAKQLKFMLLSVRVQYEQATNAAFPLDYSTEEPSPRMSQ